ncbi:MAG: hypothetical protein ACI8UR_001105 [Natronomonas sp.]|jgi:hypothetical protein|uniref:DUF5811 family protein n=1 Tax=Natronomonas sp. TaxID=2184060 RepID=UPI00398A1ACA
MHGNTPHAGPADIEPSSENRRALRRDLVDVATSTRDLLSDDFIIGAEISDNDGALHATVAVQPPAGSVVSAGFDRDDEEDADVETLAQELAAGAVLEAKHAAQDVNRAAR